MEKNLKNALKAQSQAGQLQDEFMQKLITWALNSFKLLSTPKYIGKASSNPQGANTLVKKLYQASLEGQILKDLPAMQETRV